MTYFTLLLAAAAAPPADGPAVVYVARKVVTMTRRDATAVAVARGRVVGVGSADELAVGGAVLDRAFADKVLMPAFVTGPDPDALTLSPAGLLGDGKGRWLAGGPVLVEGDADAALDALEALQKAAPRREHRVTLASPGEWTAARAARAARLGASVLFDPDAGTGAKALVDHKVAFTLRGDGPPLRLAAALSRGEEKVAVVAALRALTGAGRIAPGTPAEFVVLGHDPLAVTTRQLGEVAVWGTVSGATKRPASRQAGWDDRPRRAAAPTTGTPARHGFGLFGDEADPRRVGKCDPTCPCRGGPKSRAFAPPDPRRGR